MQTEDQYKSEIGRAIAQADLDTEPEGIDQEELDELREFLLNEQDG